MRLKGFLLLFLGLFCTYSSFSQSNELTQSRILILLDESSSMIQKWPSGKEKYKAADELILRLMDSIYAINNEVEFSLRVFGHQYTVEQNNCYDTKSEVPFSKDNRTQMALRLDDIHPLGVTPIAYALLQAAKFDLVDEDRNAYSIILITDGGESCGGDICEVMKKLMKYKVYFKPYIVSLEDDASLKVTYACMGDYLQVTKDADMPKAVTTIVNAFRPAIKITKAEYKELQTLAANVPSALKVNIPVIKATEPTQEKPVKKESGEPVITKPVKTFKDTITKVIAKETPKPKHDTTAAPKPVTKIKIDEAPVKPPPVDIPHLALGARAMLFTPVSSTKGLRQMTVPKIEIIVIPEPENIATLSYAQPKQFRTPIYAQQPMRTIPVSPVDIVVAPEPEHIAVLNPARAKMVSTPVSAQKVMEPVFASAPKIQEASEPVQIKPVSVIHPAPPVAKGMDFIAAAPTPEIKAEATITQEKIKHVSLTTVSTFAITLPGTKKMETIRSLAVPDIDVPATATPETISHAKVVKPTDLATSPPTASKPAARPIPSSPPVVTETPPVAVPKAEKIARVQILPPSTRHMIFVIADQAIIQRRPPELPPLKIDIPKTPVPKGTPMPLKETSAPFKPADYTIDATEDAKETTVEIYLTNGHGKLFTSTPQMLLMEPGTNNVVKTFYRTVDAGGNPDPIENIPVGTYNISLSAKRVLGLRNVKIVQNKKNKITVTIPPTSLSFQYAGAPDRPVVEFVARVIERNKTQGRVQDQKCNARLEYDPGNYHIMINTFPQIDRNEEIDFFESVITIPQPGFVKFIFDPKLATSVLYKQEGDRFAAFHTLNMKDVATQPLRMQPGEYQVHYRKGPGGPSVSEKVKIFFVKAKETTTVELD